MERWEFVYDGVDEPCRIYMSGEVDFVARIAAEQGYEDSRVQKKTLGDGSSFIFSLYRNGTFSARIKATVHTVPQISLIKMDVFSSACCPEEEE